MKNLRRVIMALLYLTIFVSVNKASALEMDVENGSFETGDFTGWTVVREFDSGGNWFVYSGSLTSFSNLPILPPPDGTYAAITDAEEAGSQVLYQDLDVPGGILEATCSVVVYYENRELFASPPSLSYLFPGNNQQSRIDIMDPNADVFDVGPGVLLNIFQTNPEDPLLLGYTTIEFDLAQFAGSTVRFRVANVANVNLFNFAIDDLKCEENITADIPTLSEWGLISMAGILGIAGFIVIRRRKAIA